MINAIRNPDSSPEPIPSEKTVEGEDETNPIEDQAATQEPMEGEDETNPIEDQAATQEPIPEQEKPSDEA